MHRRTSEIVHDFSPFGRQASLPVTAGGHLACRFLPDSGWKPKLQHLGQVRLEAQFPLKPALSAAEWVNRPYLLIRTEAAVPGDPSFRIELKYNIQLSEC